MSYSYTLASNVTAKIEWMQSYGGILAIGTSKEEWAIGNVDKAEPITSNSINARRESAYSSCSLPAFTFGDILIFIPATKQRMIAWQFNNQQWGFSGTNLNQMSKDILSSGVVSSTVVLDSEDRIYASLGNGDMAVLTLLPEESVLCWSIIKTSGNFKWVSSLASHDPLHYDKEIWVIVERTNAYDTFLSIEVFDNEYEPDRDLQSFSDSCLKYNGQMATIFSGLDHIEGNEVSVLADGEVKFNTTVNNGEIILDDPAQKVVVGLSYEASIWTLNLSPIFVTTQNTPTQSGLGLKRRINKVKIDFTDTLNAFVGIDADHLNLIPFRDSFNPTVGRLPLFTGIKKLTISDNSDINSKIFISSKTPTPMTINAIGCSISQED